MLVHIIQVGNLNSMGAYAGRSGFKPESAMHSMMRGYCNVIRSILQMSARIYFLPGQVSANSQARRTAI